uniref:Uncharacterized protein n=1 Tax=Mycena chlorophos TaxID=658473 RepID=A0ABQ0L7E6_MYCCL|nr:predicted protein [Mycena chlorophos]
MLRSYSQLATGRPAAMVLKGHVRHIGFEEGRLVGKMSKELPRMLMPAHQMLYVGGVGPEYQKLYDALGCMMDDRGSGKAIGGGQGWSVEGAGNEHLVRIMLANGAELLQFDQLWKLELPAEDTWFEPGTPIDCVIGLHNILLQHRTAFPALETWISSAFCRCDVRDRPAFAPRPPCLQTPSSSLPSLRPPILPSASSCSHSPGRNLTSQPGPTHRLSAWSFTQASTRIYPPTNPDSPSQICVLVACRGGIDRHSCNGPGGPRDTALATESEQPLRVDKNTQKETPKRESCLDEDAGCCATRRELGAGEAGRGECGDLARDASARVGADWSESRPCFSIGFE